VCNSQKVKYYYALWAAIRYYGLIPKDVRVETDHIAGSLPYIIVLLGVQYASERPFDFSRWKEPPHVVFANLDLNSGDLGPALKFTRQYGYISGRVIGDRYRVDLAELKDRQELVRDAWVGLGGTDLEVDLMVPNPHLRVSIGARESEIAVDSLWTLIQILVLRDSAAEKTDKCANPDCPAPYFLRTRKGQKFCSHKCAVLINVRRFRETKRETRIRSHSVRSKGRSTR
jgi:hypothetical protein